MEIEYKWDLSPDLTLERLFKCLGQAACAEAPEEIHMRATYYDTPSKDVYRMHGGLRLRQENASSVCCLKIAVSGEDGCRVRQEYEVEADAIDEGLKALKAVGAPHDVCDFLLGQQLVPTCSTDFSRTEYEVESAEFMAKLAVDKGQMSREGRSAPISEIELEFASGSEDSFHRFAQGLQKELGLVVQPMSKLARAATL